MIIPASNTVFSNNDTDFVWSFSESFSAIAKIVSKVSRILATSVVVLLTDWTDLASANTSFAFSKSSDAFNTSSCWAWVKFFPANATKTVFNNRISLSNELVSTISPFDSSEEALTSFVFSLTTFSSLLFISVCWISVFFSLTLSVTVSVIFVSTSEVLWFCSFVEVCFSLSTNPLFSSSGFERLVSILFSKIADFGLASFCSAAFIYGPPVNTNDVPINTLAAPKWYLRIEKRCLNPYQLNDWLLFFISILPFLYNLFPYFYTIIRIHCKYTIYIFR